MYDVYMYLNGKSTHKMLQNLETILGDTGFRMLFLGF